MTTREDDLIPLSGAGYRALLSLAEQEPESLRSGDHHEARRNLEKACGNEPPFSDVCLGPIDKDRLDEIVETVPPRGGPEADASHARLLRQALPPSVTASDMADPLVYASINVFHLAEYVTARWRSSKFIDSTTGEFIESTTQRERARFVTSHWLKPSKIDNTAQRLWWLYEFATRAAPYSSRTADQLLDLMADNVGLYHQMVDRSLLMASDPIRGMVIDAAMEHSLVGSNTLRHINELMRRLNAVAGACSLDLVDDDTLRQIIQGCVPPKKG